MTTTFAFLIAAAAAVWALMERGARLKILFDLRLEAQNRAGFFANLTSPYLVMSLDPYDRTVNERAEAARQAIAESGNEWESKVIERVYNRFDGKDPSGQTWCDFVAESLQIYLQECRTLNRRVSSAGAVGVDESLVHLQNQRPAAEKGRTVEWTVPSLKKVELPKN